VPRRGEFEIRWFAPERELLLCGHATLASAWVVLHELEPRRDTVTFHSAAGDLIVRRDGDRLAMALPRLVAEPLAPASVAPALAAALPAPPAWLGAGRDFYLCVYDDAAPVEAAAPTSAQLAALDKGVIVSAPGGAHGCDFVSRVFSRISHAEDPVTGSAH